MTRGNQAGNWPDGHGSAIFAATSDRGQGMKAAAAVVGVLGLCTTVASAQEMPFFTVGSGDVSGGYYAAASAICDLVNRVEMGAMRCSPDPTTGSVYNLDALRQGELDLALVQSDLQAQALTGTGRFATKGPMPDLRSVMGLYPETMTILVRTDAGATDIMDLAGKRVDIGHPSSGRRATVERMLSAINLSEDEFSELAELPTSTAIEAICDGAIDATFLMVGHPNDAIATALNSCPVTVLPLSLDEIRQVIGTGKDLTASSIPMASYRPGSPAQQSFSVTATLVARADTPQEVVEAIVTDVLQALPALGRRAPILAGLEPRGLATNGLTAPLHPGADVAFARAFSSP